MYQKGNGFFKLISRYFAKKYLKFLATIGLLNLKGCQIYVELVKKLPELNWQLHFMGIMLLGTIACGSKFPCIRQMALECGLIPLVDYGDSNTKNPYAWMARCAVIMSMIEVYRGYRETPAGLLCRELIQTRKSLETHPFVLQLVTSTKSKTPQTDCNCTVTFLFQHISIELAESFLQMKTEFEYMKRDIKLAERIKCTKGPRTRNTTSTSDFGAIISGMDSIRTQRKEKFGNLENLVISTEPYHDNYKQIQIKHGTADDLYSAYIDGVIKEEYGENRTLKPSIAKNIKKEQVYNKENKLGHHSRRKLYKYENPPQLLSSHGLDSDKKVARYVQMPVFPKVSL